MKRTLSTILLLAFLVSAIAGCTNLSAPNETTEETTTATDKETTDAPTESVSTEKNEGDSTEASEVTSEDYSNNPDETAEGSTTAATEQTTEETTVAPEQTTEETTAAPEETTEQNDPSIDELNNNAYGEAYYIAEVFGLYSRPNGWNIDDRFDIYNTTGNYTLSLVDHSDLEFKSFFRDFDKESDGILRLATIVSVNSSKGGAYIAFENAEGDKVIKLAEKNGYWVLISKTELVSNYLIPSASDNAQTFAITLEIDLDKNTAFVIINNKYAGQVEIPEDASLTRLSYGFEKTGSGSITLNHAELNKNYALSENFLTLSSTVNRTPALWDVEGNFRLQTIASEQYQDVYSMKSVTSAGKSSVAKRSFDAIYGKISFETFVLLPKKADGASVALTSGGQEILKFETVDGKFVMGDVVFHDYIANVWQCLHIDADTETGIAKIYINGKERATVSFTAESFDGVKIEFSPDSDAVMWFDDVVLYNLYDYADYPSYPQVAESTDYNVGVNVCWLWRDQNSGEGWEATSSFPEFDTFLGFYDEGLRETADWELKYMAEHGIDFIHACWYAPAYSQTDPIKKMRVSYSALHEGYMHAKYSDLVDFCIMWENTAPGAVSFEQFKEIIWNYWKEYYFSDSRYLRLDNKAVLTVWSIDRMVQAFQGAESVNAVIEFMNRELIEMGYDGLILLFAVQGVQSSGVYEYFDRCGFDGSYAYHYGTQGYSAEHQINANRANYENSLDISHHIPTISIGFNDVGRNDTRDPVISAEDHLKVCEDAREILSLYNTGTWRDNTVMISTWNEYSEGTYVFPCEQNGFTYLENIRKVFTNDTSDHSDIDVKPTQTQIDRVSHMYPDNHSPIRWHQFEESDEQKRFNDVDGYVTVKKFDMSVYGDASSWSISHGIGKFSTTSGVIMGISSSSDFGIFTNLKENIPASEAPILHIRMQSSAKGTLEIFFATPDAPNFDGVRRVAVSIKETDTMVDYYITMSSNSAWINQISRLRIDPGTTENCTFIIDLVEFMNYPPADSDTLKININHNDYELRFTPAATSDGDWEVVGETRRGFYSMMLLYHEWDRFSGKLTIKTKDERTIVFTVGSNKITVNGKEQELGYSFTLRDGLPVFKIKQLCTLLGYKYTIDGNTLLIQSCTDKEYEILGNRVEGQWEFDHENFTDGWKAQNCKIVIDGNGTIICAPTNGDPAIFKQVSFGASEYDTLTVGLKYFDGLECMTASFYFLTSSDNAWNEEKSVKATYHIPDGVSEGDTVYVTFDLSSCEKWTGNVTYIRIDAVPNDRVHEIDCVKLLNSNK